MEKDPAATCVNYEQAVVVRAGKDAKLACEVAMGAFKLLPRALLVLGVRDRGLGLTCKTQVSAFVR